MRTTTTTTPPRTTNKFSRSSTPPYAHSPKPNKPSNAFSPPSFWAAAAAATTTTKPNSEQHDRRDLLRTALATLSPLFFAREFLHFRPDPGGQQDVLERAPSHRRIALNCNRQWGKSTTAAILAVHRLYTHPGATILIIAPAGRQSGETLRKVASFLSVLNVRTRRDGVNPSSLVLPNGSRIVSLPAVDATTRGFSAISMLIIDEASRVPDRVYLALRPALAVSRGDLILISSPNGRRGFFYREMSGMQDSAASSPPAEPWLRHTGPVTECLHRIPAEFLKEEQAR
ncbi:MAG TPA: terminase family protein, partial [Bryobacteraceae bacterium]